MDAKDFDRLARTLVAPGSRRGLLRLLAGLPLLGAVAALLVDPAAADSDRDDRRERRRQRKEKNKKKKDKECRRQCCGDGDCTEGRVCLGNGVCAFTCDSGDPFSCTGTCNGFCEPNLSGGPDGVCVTGLSPCSEDNCADCDAVGRACIESIITGVCDPNQVCAMPC